MILPAILLMGQSDSSNSTIKVFLKIETGLSSFDNDLSKALANNNMYSVGTELDNFLLGIDIVESHGSTAGISALILSTTYDYPVDTSTLKGVGIEVDYQYDLLKNNKTWALSPGILFQMNNYHLNARPLMSESSVFFSSTNQIVIAPLLGLSYLFESNYGDLRLGISGNYLFSITKDELVEYYNQLDSPIDYVNQKGIGIRFDAALRFDWDSMLN